jgi:ERCC4-related helicase
VAEEIKSLRLFTELANSIAKNSKGERLQTALKRGLAEAKSKGGREKAIIFTESTRTQEYVRSILEEIPATKAKLSSSTVPTTTPSRRKSIRTG